MNKRLSILLAKQTEPLQGGAWIDVYNQSISYDIAGTIQTGISFRNLYFVTEMNSEQTHVDKVGEIHPGQSGAIYSPYGVSPTICAGEGVKAKTIIQDGMRIRKLTPRECFRLQGVSEGDIDKIQAAGISKTRQTFLAGNSICVPCLSAIFYQLFIGNTNNNQQLELF